LLPFVTLIAFDIETTGLDPEKEDILEVAGLKFIFERQNGKLSAKEVAQFQSLVKPTKLIPEEASRIHNITNQMVEDAPALPNVLRDFFRFCGLSSILVAHNASFDASFLAKGIRKHRLVVPQNPIVDSLKLLRKILPEYASHKLGEVARKLGDQTPLALQRENLHRAAYDCVVLKEVLCACLPKRYQDKDLAMDQAVKSFESVQGTGAALLAVFLTLTCRPLVATAFPEPRRAWRHNGKARRTNRSGG
jgi:DNA polymerase III epsilon subunit family exonuclease